MRRNLCALDLLDLRLELFPICAREAILGSFTNQFFERVQIGFDVRNVGLNVFDLRLRHTLIGRDELVSESTHTTARSEKRGVLHPPGNSV